MIIQIIKLGLKNHMMIYRRVQKGVQKMMRSQNKPHHSSRLDKMKMIIKLCLSLCSIITLGIG